MVGIVGAGGIGATLNTAISRYEYDSAGAILLLIIAIVHGGGIFVRLCAQVGTVRVPTSSSTDKLVWRHRTPSRQLTLWAGWLALVAIFVFCWRSNDQGYYLGIHLGRAAASR